MKIINRIKEIILKPKKEWQVIKEEPSDIKALYLNYAAPLALIPAVCSLIGMTIIGIRMPAGEVMRSPFVPTLIGSAIGYGLNMLGLIIGAWIIKLLAPTFNSKADLADAFKVVVYSMTPVWLVGIFSLIPGLGILGILGLYAIYLLALGFAAVLNTPENKVVWFTISIILVSMVVNFILSAIVFGALYGPMYMRMMAG